MAKKQKKYRPSAKAFADGMEQLTDDAVLTLSKLVAWQGLDEYSSVSRLKNDEGKTVREFCVMVTRIK